MDFESENLDLNDPKVYRDLSKPVGIQNPDIEEKARERCVGGCECVYECLSAWM